LGLKATRLANQPSTYFFIGRLSDPGSRFQVQDAQLGGGLKLAVFWDAIVISGPTVDSFAALRPRVQKAFDLTTAAYVFKSKSPIDCRLENWVEALNVSTDGVVGRFLRPSQPPPPIAPTRSPVNTPWRLAARLNRLYVASKVTENHVLALRDYQLAVLDPSDNAFIYAYRAVEDICRSVSGQPDIDAPAWAVTNNTLNISQQLTDPLRLASIAIRHNVQSTVAQANLATARASRTQTIDIAHQVIAKEMARTFPWF